MTETWLKASVRCTALSGYNFVARRDRGGERIGGGVAVFAKTPIAESIVCVNVLRCSERIWCTSHSNMGPFIVCVLDI